MDRSRNDSEDALLRDNEAGSRIVLGCGYCIHAEQPLPGIRGDLPETQAPVAGSRSED